MDELKISGARLGYDKKVVLDEVNFTLRPGSMAVLLGANGSGKSTLLRTLSGSLSLLGGKVEICGKSITRCTRRELARLLSVVLTSRSGGGALTVRECVEIGRTPYTGVFGILGREDKEAVRAAIDAVGMSDKADRFLGTLSDGERQKTMIAGALAQSTPFMILDEPTAFLDVAGRLEIIRLLRCLADAGRGILLSTHDTAPAIAAADTLLVINGSRLVSGSKSEIIASGALDRAFPGASLRFDPAKGDFVSR